MEYVWKSSIWIGKIIAKSYKKAWRIQFLTDNIPSRNSYIAEAITSL